MANERDSPDDLYPFAQALVRKLVKRHGLEWNNRQRHLIKLCRALPPRTRLQREEMCQKGHVAVAIPKALPGMTLRITQPLFKDNGP